MRPIPLLLRNRLARDPFMARCIYNDANCSPVIEWEHALLYQGKQINEAWAIVPCCTFHHRGAGLDKQYNQFRALQRATEKDLAKYPKADWQTLRNYLFKKYGE